MKSNRIRKIITNSASETVQEGERFGKTLKSGDIVLLKGDLGAGKTHFVKGIARAFGYHEDEVQSPTFALIHEYHGTTTLYHFDCYRLLKSDEALRFGLNEYVNGDGISLIEWPEIIADLLPEGCLEVQIRHIDKAQREISIHQ